MVQKGTEEATYHIGEKRMKKKILKILKIVVLGYVALQVILSLLCALLHSTYFKEKYEQIQPYGELVDVFDGKMHITQAGKGETTIVLLPGLGEGLPSADFAPFIRELSKDYRVVCVDYFGVGFSSETSRERTCSNYVEEIREVLKNANIEGPYVLMPHSISSLYCEYYASCYPDEVNAIISLDGSSSAYNEAMPNIFKKVMPILYKLQGFCGAEVNTMLTTNKKQWMDEYGYTEKEVDDYIIYQGFAINNNLIETSISTDVLIKDVMALEYPIEVPYHKIISEYTYTHNAGNISGEQYHMEHLERVGAEDSYTILDGTHFIYRNNAEEIGRIVKEFLDETKSGT